MKRFYKEAEPRGDDRRLGVALDGRPIRTPGKRDLLVPSEALAAAIAAEWDAQQDEIRPATMPLTRLAATAIDRVAPQRDAIIRQIANYAGTDLVCYRADAPAGAGGAPAGGLAAADRLGGAALRRAARGHHRGDPEEPVGGEPAGLCRGGRGARRFCG